MSEWVSAVSVQELKLLVCDSGFGKVMSRMTRVEMKTVLNWILQNLSWTTGMISHAQMRENGSVTISVTGLAFWMFAYIFVYISKGKILGVALPPSPGAIVTSHVNQIFNSFPAPTAIQYILCSTPCLFSPCVLSWPSFVIHILRNKQVHVLQSQVFGTNHKVMLGVSL